VFDGNARTIQRVAAKVQRVLVVDRTRRPRACWPSTCATLGARADLLAATIEEKGYAMARTVDPQLIFVEHGSSGGVDGVALARKIRRSDLVPRGADHHVHGRSHRRERSSAHATPASTSSCASRSRSRIWSAGSRP
jgi:hypothetical protein